MWSQNLERLIASDIQQLIADEVEESSTLEYKESLPAKGDDGRREFLYYVAALANGGGGFLIFGIADRRVDNKATGIADAIIGIETNNPPNEIWRMENMIRDGIAPRLTGIHFKSLDCDGISVLVLAIPNSLNAPHMVTFQKTNKFYSRVSTGKYLMSVDQIRNAFSQQGALRDTIQSWRKSRADLLKRNEGPVNLPAAPTMLFHVIPASSFSLQSVSSTWAVSEKRRLQMHCPKAKTTGLGRYNSDGFLKSADYYGNPGDVSGYTQLSEMASSSTSSPNSPGAMALESNLRSLQSFWRRKSLPRIGMLARRLPSWTWSTYFI